MHIIDRRLNPSGKSLVNRQRFLRRTRALVKQAVRDSLNSRSIRDIDKEQEVSVPIGDIQEPSLHKSNQGGNREHILPGNREFQTGDRLKRPPSGGAGDGGSDPGQGGDGEDAFRFALSREEFLDLFLEDLELPDLAKRRLASSDTFDVRRAGYKTTGSPSALSVVRTMRNAMSRRLALRRPSNADQKELEDAIAALEALETRTPAEVVELNALREKLKETVRRRQVISYIDPIDMRYRRFEVHPRPITQAVMFCLMDVSGSMNEHMKELAKVFFILLYLFVSRSYRHVDIVFIRHTDKAQEVDEDTFFYSTETGGTQVSSALDEALAIIKARYPSDAWNIYVAQASDGDNMTRDNPRVVSLMKDELLPLCQYVAYLEVGDEGSSSAMNDARTTLWEAYEPIAEADRRLAMRKVHNRQDIYPVFRELFQRRQGAHAA